MANCSFCTYTVGTIPEASVNSGASAADCVSSTEAWKPSRKDGPRRRLLQLPLAAAALAAALMLPRGAPVADDDDEEEEEGAPEGVERPLSLALLLPPLASMGPNEGDDEVDEGSDSA